MVAAVQAGIDAANERLARVEQIKKFTIVRGDWLPGGDELTPDDQAQAQADRGQVRRRDRADVRVASQPTARNTTTSEKPVPST